MSVKISSLNTASTIDSGDDINIAGNNPLAFSDWGGGWYMEDTVWIRSVAGKSLWMGGGLVGANGGLTIGYGGTTPPTGGAIIAGALLIGTTSTTNTAAGKIVNRLGGTSNPDLVLNGGAWSIASIGGEPALYLSSNIVAATGIPGATQTAKGGMGFEYSSSTSPTDLVLGIFGTPTVASSVKIFNSTERLRIASSGTITLFSDAILLEGGTNTQLAIKDGTYSGVFSPSFNSLSDNILRFRNYDSVERMRITAAGLVGIGTSTPKSILEIVGNLSVTHTNGSSGYSEVLFYENNTLQADIFVNGTSNTNYAGANSMNIWQGSNAPIAFYTNGTNERMRIAAGGNLYIGHTDDYGARLSVKQPSSGNAANFSNGVDADLNIEITATGAATKYAKLSPSVGIPLVLSTTTGSNVLIGTTIDNGYKLEVNGEVSVNGDIRIKGNNQVYFDTTGDVNSNYVGVTNDYWLTLYCGRGNNARIDLTAGNGILFSEQGTERMRIADGGNVLIGTTTNSGYKLYVNGTGRFSNDLVAVNGTTDSLYSRITSPGGGTSLGNAPIASAIKIALPADGSFLNTMISFTIHIYNYSAGTSRTIKVGGYSYFDTSWYNTFTYQSGGSQIDDINIRFGTEGGCACVWIGETTTYWHYPNIFITDVQVGHSQSSNLTKGWNVSLVSSFGSVQSTIVSYENITTYTIASQSVAYATTAGALTSMLISQFTNDAGYITSASLAGYLPLTGGTLTGNLTTSGWFINSTDTYGIKNSSNGSSFWSSYGGWTIESTNTSSTNLVFYTTTSLGAQTEQFRIGWANSIGIFILNDQGADASIVAYQGAGYGGYLTGTWNVTNNLTVDGDGISVNNSGIYDTALIGYQVPLHGDYCVAGMIDETASGLYVIRFNDFSYEQSQLKLYPTGDLYIYGQILATNHNRYFTSSYLRLTGSTAPNDWFVKQSDSTGFSIIKNADTLSGISTAGTHTFSSTSNLLATFTDSGSTFGATAGNYSKAYFHVTGSAGATHAMFGTTYPLLFGSNYPTVYYNMYYSSGWKIASGTSVYGGATVYDPVNGIFYWYLTGTAANADGTVTPSIQFRIDRNGQVSIGNTASSTHKLYVTGTTYLGGNVGVLGYVNASNLNASTLTTNGLVYSNGGTLTNINPSDLRLKEDINPLQYGLKEVMALNPVTYKWKDGSNGGQRSTGLIAQDVKEVMPDYVKNVSEDSDLLGLDSYAINIVLINAIKELKAEIEILKNK